jgi:hypothetical protein
MTRDYEGAKAFYGSVFGYEYEQMGDGTKFQYSTIHRGDGKVIGGIGAMGAEVPADMTPAWATYFNVSDTDAMVAKAVELGATVLREPWDTPCGRMAMIQGPQGEIFSIAQAPRQGDNTEAGS